jgi:hypothetical protein
MKKQTESRFSQISAKHTKELTKVVKETLATGFTQPKIFSTVDLWNIQRRSKFMGYRRHFA